MTCRGCLGRHLIHVSIITISQQNTRHSPNAVSMLAHRLRRWPKIETALDECLVFTGWSLEPRHCHSHRLTMFVIVTQKTGNIKNRC